MGAKESTPSLRDQAWCSASTTTFCKSCVTEVENVNTEIKRATPPIPKTEMQMMLREQQRRGGGGSHTASFKAEPVMQQYTAGFGRNADGNYQTSQFSQMHGPSNASGHQQIGTMQELQVSKSMQERIGQLQQIVLQAPRLQLRVLSSAYLEKGDVLTINALGLEGGTTKRPVQDGYTYFGCKKSIKRLTKENTSSPQHQLKVANGAGVSLEKGYSHPLGATGTSNEEGVHEVWEKEIINDFVIPTKNEEEKEKHRGRQFQIAFDINTYTYMIKDLGIGYGAFVKLARPLVLRDNFLLNMGESYIVANLIKTLEDSSIKLRLKIFSVVKADQPDVFFCSNEDQEIVIGRTPNCDIKIDDKLLSKMQATIRNEEGQWVLYDGYQGRESTNGTWLYLNEDCEIEEGMVFKSNQTFFEASIIQ